MGAACELFFLGACVLPKDVLALARVGLSPKVLIYGRSQRILDYR